MHSGLRRGAPPSSWAQRIGRAARIGPGSATWWVSVVAASVSMPSAGHALSCGETVSATVVMKEDLFCPTGHGVVLGDGASLDCDGRKIVGGDAPGRYGVYANRVTDVSVQNCTIEHFEVGVRMRTATAATVQNSFIQHNTAYGIELTQSSTGALIQGNTITNNSDEGCHLSGPTDRDAAHRVVGNVVTNNSVEGIYLLNANGNTIENNLISGQGTAGIYLNSSDRNAITGNMLTNDPIQLAGGSRFNILRSNTVMGQRIKFDGYLRQHRVHDKRPGGGRRAQSHLRLLRVVQ